jgi:hypothetical protein
VWEEIARTHTHAQTHVEREGDVWGVSARGGVVGRDMTKRQGKHTHTHGGGGRRRGWHHSAGWSNNVDVVRLLVCAAEEWTTLLRAGEETV